jgi:hypothetical protein
MASARALSILAAAVWLAGMLGAGAAAAQVPAESPSSAIVIDKVHVLSMENERVARDRRVIVDRGRIVAIGSASEVASPPSAHHIDGAGRYLLPGLTDAHVHLDEAMPWARVRPDFGDGPLYLAFGVTSVVNLRGTPTHLEWRRRVEQGELLAPTIYTSGDFINEPRATSVEDVQAEVTTQASQGYDLIKFHELPRTRVGLSEAAYRRMVETARAQRIPLVGHAPVNLGLRALLAAQQPLAHVGALSNIYLLPVTANREFVLVPATSLLVLLVVTLVLLVGTLRRKRSGDPIASRLLRLVSALLGCLLLDTLCALTFLPGGPLHESIALRALFTALGVFCSVLSVVLARHAAATWRGPSAPLSIRLHAVAATASAFAFTFALLWFWVPVSWRSTDRGLDWLAEQVRAAGISVQTTLVIYDTFATDTRAPLFQDPALAYLHPQTRAMWQRLPREGVPLSALPHFMQRLTAALHRAGVPLIAGTDAMGLPLVAPGSSLHRELELLVASGLTPYEALKAATVNTAGFLGRAADFGTVSVGKRADLLLVDGNPLENLATLQHPAGVMVRGRWLPRTRLGELLEELTGER